MADEDDDVYESNFEDSGEDEIDLDADLEQEPETRESKKRNRYDELQAKMDERDRELAELRGRIDEQARLPRYQPATAPGQDDRDGELAGVEGRIKTSREEERRLNDLWARETSVGSMTAARQSELQEQVQRLQDERQELVIERREIRRRPSAQAQAEAANNAQMRARYPDIFNDADMFALANAEHWRRKTLDKKYQGSLEDFDSIADQVRTELGRKAPPVSDATRRRASGHGVGGSRVSGASRKAPPLSTDEKKMARSLYSELVREKGEEAAYARFTKQVMMEPDEGARQRRASG